MSQEDGNVWFDPLISKHQAFSATLRKKFAAPIGPILPQHLPGYQFPRTPAVSNAVSTCSLLNNEDDGNDDLMSMAITLNQMLGA